MSVQGGPASIAISASDPTTAWVADGVSTASRTGNVTPIDLTTDTAGSPIAVGNNPQSIAVSPDGTTAWVVCYQSQTLVPVSTRTQKPGASIHLSGGPYAIAVVSRSASATTTTTTPKKKKQS